MITAKFKVGKRTPNVGGPNTTEIELTPDYGEGRNKEWAEKTPAGVIRMTMKNDVAEKFPSGAAFTVMFEEEK